MMGMSFCEHCEGQRFDRAQVLRALRDVRRRVRLGEARDAEDALLLALKSVRELDIPHLQVEEDEDEDVIVH